MDIRCADRLGALRIDGLVMSITGCQGWSMVYGHRVEVASSAR
jgi:hypothetical protein